MKKIILSLFLIFSIAIVNAGICLERDAVLSATQVSIYKDLQASFIQTNLSSIGVDLCNYDVSLFFENCQLAIMDYKVSPRCLANFQSKTQLKEMLKLRAEVVTPRCRTVLFG